MGIEKRNSEIIDDTMAHAVRDETPQQRLAIAFKMWNLAKVLLTNYLRSQHPEWGERIIRICEAEL